MRPLARFSVPLFVLLIAMPVALLQSTQAQTFTVLHAFTGGQDGSAPQSGMAIDRGGKLYGTTRVGAAGYGEVFRLTSTGSGWIFASLYSFEGQNDGIYPEAIVIGPNGSLYGTTETGGIGGPGCGDYGCGKVFNLRPPAHACASILCSWSEAVVHQFSGVPDGGNPAYGAVIFDQMGNIYGTTEQAGLYNYGIVYELMPSPGGYVENVLYAFSGGNDGGFPLSGVTFDPVGNLYGTTFIGGYNENGTVFQLTATGSGWTVSTIYSFTGASDGANPVGGLIFDQLGNLYGTTSNGGVGNGGTVFELTPSNGSWTLTVLASLNSSGSHGNPGPWGSLAMDGSGNLYGTTNYGGANDWGSVFKLTPSNGVWIYTDLHDFALRDDGALPECNVTLDRSGDIYGTATSGGSYNDGVVWEITP